MSRPPSLEASCRWQRMYWVEFLCPALTLSFHRLLGVQRCAALRTPPTAVLTPAIRVRRLGEAQEQVVAENT